MPPADFDRIARPYRWLEYFSFGPMLERCRFYRIPQLTPEKFPGRRILVLGDGDGRFLARILTRNPRLHADAVDQSPAMLRLLQSRLAAVGAADRVRTHLIDALAFEPKPQADRDTTYDALITHFFLDCLTTDEVHALALKLRPHLAPNAPWIVSEFAIPSGPAALPARAIIAALYTAFHLITGLRTRTLPDYAAALTRAGFVLRHRQSFLAGLLVSTSPAMDGLTNWPGQVGTRDSRLKTSSLSSACWLPVLFFHHEIAFPAVSFRGIARLAAHTRANAKCRP